MKQRINMVGVWFWAVAAVVSAGCKPVLVHISSPDQPHPALRGKSADQLAALFTRKVEKGTLNISAMLWDRAYVEAYLGRLAARKHWDQATLQGKLADWSQRYLRGKISFRIRLEILNRPMMVAGKDPLLELDSWQWRITDSLGHTYQAQSAKTQVKQMFRGTQGRFNWRVLGDVTFTHRPDASQVRWVELVALPPGDFPPIRLPRWYLQP